MIKALDILYQARTIALVARAMRSYRLRFNVNATWRTIHQALGVGQLTGAWVQFQSEDRLTIIQWYRDQNYDLMGMDLALLSSGRLGRAIVLPKEKGGAPVTAGVVLVRTLTGTLRLGGGTFTHPAGGAVTVPCENIAGHSHTRLVVVENLAIILEIERYQLPGALGEDPLFLYRGGLGYATAPVNLVLEMESTGTVAFTDYDPAGLVIALRDLPNISHVVVPTAQACHDIIRTTPSTVQTRQNQSEQEAGLGAYRGFEPVDRLLADRRLCITQEAMAGKELECVPIRAR